MSVEIDIRGAREHNLKDISVKIPRNKLVVFTGLSGSGKSSLAFDTIYAEGQRRYLESLSAYARQFLEQMHKPAVDSIEGLSPTISIEQKNISRNPRSTVGTVTEIYDFLRLLFSRTGTPHCYQCGAIIESQPVSKIVDLVLSNPEGTKLAVLAPVVRGKKGEYQKELSQYRSQGYVRARIDGQEVSLTSPVSLKKSHKHDISIYMDRIVLRLSTRDRLIEAITMAVELSEGLCEIEFIDEKRTLLFSTKFACPKCGISFPELEPRNFSFNSKHGACETCFGLGAIAKVDIDKVVPDPSLSLMDGAIAPWSNKPKSWLDSVLKPISKKFKIDLEASFSSLSDAQKEVLFYGSGSEEIEFGYSFKQKFTGVVGYLNNLLKQTDDAEAEDLRSYLSEEPCSTCQGTRLRIEARSVLIAGKNIAEVSALTIPACSSFILGVKFEPHKRPIAEPILKEIRSRLEFLTNVGLSYLTLARSAATLSGGESQRIRLATQLGSSLIGVLYILDEPSIGLHQRDNLRLIQTLSELRDQGNSVIVVEHDEETIESADFVVDMGPGAGDHGGEIVFAGDPKLLLKCKESRTGAFLLGKEQIGIPSERRIPHPEKMLTVLGANKNNLKNLRVDFPLGLFVCVTGVSGSGKSTLILDTVLEGLQNKLAGAKSPARSSASFQGLEHLDKVIYVDQSPIGRTPRSNPATYTGVFTEIRTLFAALPEAKALGFSPSRFSFNVAGGRCEACNGDGTLRISMTFLPDVYVECEVCRGKRYNRETLLIQYRGKSIADVLDMTIENAATFFERVPVLREKFKTLMDVGLGYITVGQSAVTLSGGEAQRIKLARELTKRATGRTLYILDEPTTGLHFEDVRKLLEILQALVNQGNSVFVIEHNLDVIKQADHVIDMGPEGGEMGGEIVAQGTPEDIAKAPRSSTGEYLRKTLEKTAARGESASRRMSKDKKAKDQTF